MIGNTLFTMEIGSNVETHDFNIMSTEVTNKTVEGKFTEDVITDIAQIIADVSIGETRFFTPKNKDLYTRFKIFYNEDNKSFVCEAYLLCEDENAPDGVEVFTDSGEEGIFNLVLNEEFESLDELIERFSPSKGHKFNTFDRISVKLVYLTDDYETIVGKSKIDNNSNSFNTSIDKQHVIGLFQKIKQTERFKALVDQYKPNSALIFKIDVKTTVEFIGADEFERKTINAFITVNGVDNKEARFKKLIFDDMNFDSVKDFIEYVSN